MILCESSNAATIESLVMPGPLIEGHADLEDDCSNCHEAFERDNQRTLCLGCHEDVAIDVEAGGGFHGLFKDARESDCADCHTDHEGRGTDIVLLDEEAFDHDFTDFALQGGHLEAACEDCHTPDERYREAPSDCLSCHEDDNVHGDFMGTECADCHSPHRLDGGGIRSRHDRLAAGRQSPGGPVPGLSRRPDLSEYAGDLFRLPRRG